MQPIQFHQLPDMTGVTDQHVMTALTAELLAIGYTITVHGGGDEPDYVGTDLIAIMEAINAVEEAEIVAEHPTDKAAHQFWALLIPSNGAECICDHSGSQFAEDLVNRALLAAVVEATAL